MKVFMLLFYLFLAGNILHGYSKKVVLGTYSSEANAKRELRKLSTVIPQYDKLYKLSKENDFNIHVRPFGKYYIVVVEPIRDKKVLYGSLAIIKEGFKKAFVSDAPEVNEAKAVKEIKKVQEKEVEKVKQTDDAKEIEEPEVKKEQIEPDTIQSQAAEDKNQSMPPIVEEVEKEDSTQKSEQTIPPIQETPVIQKERFPKSDTPAKAEIKTDTQVGQEQSPSISEIIARHFSFSYIIYLIIAGVIAYYGIKFKKIYDQY